VQDRTEELIELTKGRSHFSASLPGLQIAWDSTSLGTLKECPRKYYYTLVEKWRAKSEALPLTYGIMYHSCLEHYARFKAQGMNHDEATRATLRHAYKLTAVYDGILGAEPGPDKVFTQWQTTDTRRSKATLIRSVMWYLDQFGDKDPTQTVILANGKPAVELNFKIHLDMVGPDGSPYVFCGHIDRMVIFNEELWVQDHKTTIGALDSRYFDRYTPDNQMSLYTTAAKVAFEVEAKGCMIDAAQVAVGFTRFRRGFVHRTPGQLDEFMRDTQYWLKMAEGFAEAQHWPMNDKSCHNYGGCKFLQVCNKDPKVRAQFITQDFEKQEWNPLIPRE